MIAAVLLVCACKEHGFVGVEFVPRLDNVLLGTAYVELSEPAAVDLVCDTDGLTQRFSGTSSQGIPLYGLLPASSYDCSVEADGYTRNLSFRTDRLPDDLPVLELQGDPSQVPFDYVLLTTTLFCNHQEGDVAHAMILDRYGRVRWYRALDEWVVDAVASRMANREDLLISALSGYDPGEIRISDQEIVRVAPPTNDGWTSYHHDLKERADGTWLALGSSTNTLDDVYWSGFEVLVIDPTSGQFTFRWRSQEAVDAGTLPPPATKAEEGTDLYHANSVIDVDDDDGTGFWVSLLDSKAIVRLDPESRALLWKMGPGLDFELTEGTWFEGQHALTYKDGMLTLYDNHRVDGSKASRAVELAVDVGGRTLHEVWSHELDDYYPSFGDVDRLDDTHVMITSGSFWCDPEDTPGEVRVVRDQEVIWKLVAPFDQVIYRAEAWNDPAVFGDD
jgi:hypothetical protein